MHRLFRIILIFIITCSLCIYVYAQDLTELQEKSNQINQALTESNNRLQVVQDNISANMQELQELDNNIAQSQEELNTINTNINNASKEIIAITKVFFIKLFRIILASSASNLSQWSN